MMVVMTVIAPSAQRLAEDNNVDWQLLEGSGEGGSVVEQDVLSYLARVMQGDEVTNPTPEPLPEGMGAWPEEAQRRRSEPAPKDLFASFSAPTPAPVPLEEAFDRLRGPGELAQHADSLGDRDEAAIELDDPSVAGVER